eukprot:c9675_g1_i1.p1 GENE.c9675_g1_i1~~c9675_g1_i1.p1  ORF type:complete len:552 (-),score=140.39 c9675_g1_i1:850-2274(-)
MCSLSLPPIHSLATLNSLREFEHSLNPSPQPSGHSLFYPLPCADTQFWNLIETQLGTPAASFPELSEIISTLFPQTHSYKCDTNLHGLEQALAALKRKVPDFDFWNEVYPSIVKSALKLPELFGGVGDNRQNQIPVLVTEIAGTLRLTRQQVHSLLANSFFGTLRQIPTCGNLQWMRIFSSGDPVSVGRTECILLYFYITLYFPNLPGAVEYERCVLDDPPEWSTLAIPLTEVEIETGAVETVEEAQAMVDFANHRLMIFQIIASATQEEVLFSIFPECFATLLFCEKLAVHESITVRGLYRYCSYSGYGETFKCVPIQTPKIVSDMIAIDALVNYPTTLQYERRYLERDLNKALCGFASCVTYGTIATGRWGCGVFNGDPVLKFLQQVMAASVSRNPVRYRVFSQQEEVKLLRGVLEDVRRLNLTVGELFQLLDEYSPNARAVSLDSFIYLWKRESSPISEASEAESPKILEV